jgi:hypothetical protein
MGGATQTDTGATSIALGADDKIYIQGYNTNWLVTSQVFRDPSSWYHIVVAMDSTNATANNRLRLYVNGVEVTAFSTRNNLTLNTDYGINQAALHCIAFESVAFGNNYFDGYFGEINFVDGQQLTPSSFGSTNTTTGVWQPAKYTGTYGTNGFYLNFSDNSNNTATTIGKDYSGNGNNWTPNNISVTAGTTYDSMVDSPTVGATSSNYAVLNPLPTVGSTSHPTFSEANLKVDFPLYGYAGPLSTLAIPAKNTYCEFTCVAVGTGGLSGVGIAQNNADLSGASVLPTLCVTYGANGSKVVSGSFSTYGSSYTTGDVIGIAYNQSTNEVTFYKNNVSQGALSLSTLSGDLFFCCQATSGAITFAANFGQRPFSYTPPTGYVALNTYNLTDSTIKNGAAYMAATLYTGNSSTQSITNTASGASFQPDLVWVKARSAATDNKLTDSVRGATKAVISNSSAAETTDLTGVTAFNSNGFTLGASTDYNNTGVTYVGWQWKKGASSGFDIVSQTLATTGINTITHSLNAVPTMVLAKKTSAGAEQWLVYQSSGTTQSQYLGLNNTNGVATSGNLWGSSAFTSSQIYFNGTSGNTYVFYIFAPVAGFSVTGLYTGNGVSDGPFVYCGFRPRFVMIKANNTTGGWSMTDTSRDTYNLTVNKIEANTALSEPSNAGLYQFDILSNGFKIRQGTGYGINNSADYIYIAFAENPFKYALAR